MKKPSRTMPGMPETEYLSNTMVSILSICFSGGLIYLLIEIPVVLPLLALLYSWGKVSYRRQQAKLIQIAAAREGDSICTFARSFDCRNVDTWAIRAVYEYIQQYLKDNYSCSAFPIQKEDSLSLFIEDEDLDEDWMRIAARINRSSNREDVEKNLFRDRVETVEDLVLFLINQPKIPEQLSIS